ncbi:MAG: preprotein translocase subunit YajC [Clostridiales bacterium]|nr:MAG: preprotein translocase subunit YajC [Clostridiales bacterium]
MAAQQQVTNPDGTTRELTTGEQFLQVLMTVLPIALVAVAFWFFLIRPQKKKEKEDQKMRNSIGVGDTITTIGGITGVVRQVKEDDDLYIIETGADKSKIAIKKWAVQTKEKSAEDQQ